MTLKEVTDYCLKKNGAYLDYPFSPVFPVIKVGTPTYQKGRIFAQPFVLKGKAVVTLNCNPSTAEYFRSIYSTSVVRGYHCPPVQQPYFNTVSLDGSLSDTVILSMIDHAYDVVVAKLPKYVQAQLQGKSQEKIYR